MPADSLPGAPAYPNLPDPVEPGLPLTALAPMQDVTNLSFMEAIAKRGAPDFFVTEYFRVHAHSTLDKPILRSIVENRAGRPVFAQLIGEDLRHLERTAKALHAYPIAGIDLNLGCPAPKVYKKNVGGGLLRDLPQVDRILGVLRAASPGRFTVKTRIGFEDDAPFAALLELVARHEVDLLSVHGRTVKGMYRSQVSYDRIRQAAESVPCPVLANGDVSSAAKARRVLEETGAAGVMAGRHAIRNPWLFGQIRQACKGQAPFRPRLRDVHAYIEELYAATDNGAPERARVNKMKKYLNFIGQGVDPAGAFLREARRARSEAELFDICARHLLTRPDAPFSDEPYPGLVARPNCEAPACAATG